MKANQTRIHDNDPCGEIRRLVEESLGRFRLIVAETETFPSWQDPIVMPVPCKGISNVFDELSYSIRWGMQDNLLVGQAVSISNPDPDEQHCFSMLTLSAHSKEEMLDLLALQESQEIIYDSFLRLIEEMHHV